MATLSPVAAAAVREYAIQEYPVLRRLVDTSHGVQWDFPPLLTSASQDLIAVWREWSETGFIEVIAVVNYRNALAYRCNAAGDMVWQRNGDVEHVVDGMSELPPPGARATRNLVKGCVPVGAANAPGRLGKGRRPVPDRGAEADVALPWLW